MSKRKVSNPLALAVLSLLTERPMHPYEMLGVMRMRELTNVIKVSQSSLYSVIEALQREGLIIPEAIRREGRYPERTIYATTESGRDELKAWLRSLIRQPQVEYTEFAAGLAFMGYLPPEEVATLLEEHARNLQEQIASTQSTLQRGAHLGVDRLFLIEDQYSVSILQARYDFIQQLIREINDGTLTEMSNEQRIWKITRPDLASLGSDSENEAL
jgi:DNA-binding PadR family transcriptional regulator